MGKQNIPIAPHPNLFVLCSWIFVILSENNWCYHAKAAPNVCLLNLYLLYKRLHIRHCMALNLALLASMFGVVSYILIFLLPKNHRLNGFTMKDLFIQWYDPLSNSEKHACTTHFDKYNSTLSFQIPYLQVDSTF
jgi:hypothetical protein